MFYDDESFDALQFINIDISFQNIYGPNRLLLHTYDFTLVCIGNFFPTCVFVLCCKDLRSRFPDSYCPDSKLDYRLQLHDKSKLGNVLPKYV